MIRWRFEQPTASRRRTGWAKIFATFDTTTIGAKAFGGGEYLTDGVLREDPEGTLVVQCSPAGSIKNSRTDCELFRVTADGLESISGTFSWEHDWLEIQDAVLALLAVKPAQAKCPHCGGVL